MMRLGHTVTIDMVERYKDFIDWVFEGKNREDYDWAFCTYMDGEPYVNIMGSHIRFDQFEHREEYERKYNEAEKRKQKRLLSKD